MTRFRLIAVDFLLMTLAFVVVNGAKRGTVALPEGYGLLLGLFYLAWGVSGVMGKKFVPAEYAGFREGARTLVKSGLYLAFTIAFVVVMFGMGRYSRVQVFATCGVLLGLETVVLGVYFSVRKHRKAEPDIESVDQVRQMLAQERYDLNVDFETVRQCE